MSQQPDQLFREKLENFQLPAPERAWERVESRIRRGSGANLAMKIAASIALLATITTAALLFNTQEVVQTAKNQSPDKAEKASPVQEQPHVTEPAPQETEEKAQKSSNIPDQSRQLAAETRTTRTESERPSAPQTEEAARIETETQSMEGDEHNSTLLAEIGDETEPVLPGHEQRDEVERPSDKTTRVTLVYSVEEVNKKYLDKEAMADATSDDKKPSTLKKLLAKAQELKYDQDPLGDLRQKKNEILAFNFRGDKQRSENK